MPVCITCIAALGLFPAVVQAENPSVVTLLPPSEVDELAYQVGREQGAGIESIEVVSTTLGAATTAISPSVILPGAPTTEPVVLIVMHGYFILGDASVPPCASAPTGKVLGLVAKQGSGFVTETSLNDGSPDLEALGSVEAVPVPEGIPRQGVPRQEEQPASCTDRLSLEPTGTGGPVVQSHSSSEIPTSGPASAGSVLDVTVAGGKGGRGRLRRAQATVVVRNGTTTASYKGSRLSLHLVPARYQLSAELRFSVKGQRMHCPRRSVVLRPATVMSVTLHCPVGRSED
jgi:hypothetical protein